MFEIDHGLLIMSVHHHQQVGQLIAKPSVCFGLSGCFDSSVFLTSPTSLWKSLVQLNVTLLSLDTFLVWGVHQAAGG